MKKCAYIIVLAAALAAGQALAAQVTQIALSYENGATIARVTADGPFQFSHQTEIPKDGKGDRMILDLIGVTTGLSAKSFADLPKCGITGIRTGQYAVTPEKVVRVVFDLTKAPVYQVERQGNSVKVTFTDKAVTAFASWNSDAATKPAPPVPAPKPSVAQTTSPIKPTSLVPSGDKATATEADRLASLSGSSKPATPPAATLAAPVQSTSTVKVVTVANKPATPVVSTPAPSTVKPVAVENAKPQPLPVSQPTVAPAPTKVVATANTKPTVQTAPVTPAPAVSKPVTEPAKVVTPSPTVAVKPAQLETKTTVLATPTPLVQKLVSEPVKAVTPSPTIAVKPVQLEVKSTIPAPAPVTSAKDAGVKPSAQATPPAVAVKPAATPATGNQIQQAPSAKPNPPAVAVRPAEVVKTQSDKPQDKPTAVAQQNATDQAKPQAVAPTTLKPEVKPTGEPSKPVVSTPAVAVQTPPATDKKEQPAPVTTPATPTAEGGAQLAEADKTETANPDLTANKATSRFRRTPASDAKIKGTMVAEFPQRLVVKYESMGNRDPFATLIDDSRTYNTPIQNRVPNIDGLRLVGIIESDRGATDNRALFEDKNGYSYILSSGDKVQRGYVLRVEHDRVYFQIFEYGWSRTVALAIENAN